MAYYNDTESNNFGILQPDTSVTLPASASYSIRYGAENVTMDGMTSYSNKTLRDKLGLKAGQRSAIVRLPDSIKDELGDIADLNVLSRVVGVPFELIIMFITSREQLDAVLPNLVRHLHSGGILWLAWAKRTSPLHSGVTEPVIRAAGLGEGLIDVNVSSLSADWAGQKFVHSVNNRK